MRARLAAVVAAACLLLAVPACTPGLPPSFVLITLDTTRADHLGSYGYAAARTPHLDRFERRSRVYTRAYSTSSWTLPAHASIFTGLWPFEHGAGGYSGEGGAKMRPLGERFTTLAELLGAAGYRTAGVVAGSALAPQLGTRQGFDVYEAKEALFGARGRWVADRALERIASFGDEPYFLFLNFFDPHTPYRPPPPWGDGLEEVPDVSGVLARAGLPPGEAAPLGPEDERALAVARRGYDAEITYMDAQLGRVLEALEASRQADRTWVIITSDHGESFGEHFYLAHGLHLYEDNLRVPLLVSEPGDPHAGERVETPVQTHRLFGTILRAAGVEPPDGVDVRPLGEGPIVAAVPRTYLAERMLGPRAWRELRAFYRHPYKLILRDDEDVELYDLSADPGELRDLSGERPQVAAELRRALAAILAKRPARYEDRPMELDEPTAAALRAMGYIE